MTAFRDFREILKEKLKDPAFRRAWEELELPYQVARAVIGLRLRLGLTQRELARKAGVPRALAARLEAGTCLPSLRVLDKMARRLGYRVRLELVPAGEGEPGPAEAAPRESPAAAAEEQRLRRAVREALAEIRARMAGEGIAEEDVAREIGEHRAGAAAREEARRAALEALTEALAGEREAKGVDEDEVMADFEAFRRARRDRTRNGKGPAE